MRNAMNEVMRDGYIDDCQRGVDKWNRAIAAHGIPFQLVLPSRRFHRHIGVHAGSWYDPQGNLVTEQEWTARQAEWLPGEADQAFVRGLMQRPVLEPGKMAGWLSAPRQGIKGRPVDFEYVRHAEG